MTTDLSGPDFGTAIYYSGVLQSPAPLETQIAPLLDIDTNQIVDLTGGTSSGFVAGVGVEAQCSNFVSRRM